MIFPAMKAVREMLRSRFFVEWKSREKLRFPKETNPANWPVDRSIKAAIFVFKVFCHLFRTVGDPTWDSRFITLENRQQTTRLPLITLGRSTIAPTIRCLPAVCAQLHSAMSLIGGVPNSWATITRSTWMKIDKRFQNNEFDWNARNFPLFCTLSIQIVSLIWDECVALSNLHRFFFLSSTEALALNHFTPENPPHETFNNNFLYFPPNEKPKWKSDKSKTQFSQFQFRLERNCQQIKFVYLHSPVRFFHTQMWCSRNRPNRLDGNWIYFTSFFLLLLLFSAAQTHSTSLALHFDVNVHTEFVQFLVKRSFPWKTETPQKAFIFVYFFYFASSSHFHCFDLKRKFNQKVSIYWKKKMYRLNEMKWLNGAAIRRSLTWFCVILICRVSRHDTPYDTILHVNFLVRSFGSARLSFWGVVWIDEDGCCRCHAVVFVCIVRRHIHTHERTHSHSHTHTQSLVSVWWLA